MDIQILLYLQQFRTGAGAILMDFFSKMTFISEIQSVIIIMAVIYWCVSKDFGVYLLMGWHWNRLVNGLMKVTVCAYRPWIREPNIVPDEETLKTTTGYSFPSGHTMNAATVYGGGAIRKDLPKVLRILLGFIFIAAGFSRMYLSVHTIQDVVIGGVTGILVMWLTLKLMRWIEAHPDKDWIVVCAGIAASVAIGIYAGLKPYPEDFDAAGNLIVDGAKMAKDTFKGIGWCSAFLIGWILERRYVGFSTDIPMKDRITRLVGGLLSYYAVNLILVPLIKNWIPGAAGTVASCFVQMFFIIFIVPLCIKLTSDGKDRSVPG